MEDRQPQSIEYERKGHRACERLAWLGVHLDSEANQQHARTISQADAPVAVYVIPTDEEIVMARAVHRLVG